MNYHFQIHILNKTGVLLSNILNAYATLDLLSYAVIDNTHENKINIKL